MVLFWTVVKLIKQRATLTASLSMVLFWTVVKPELLTKHRSRRFEYGVILNGSQTAGSSDSAKVVFEYGVILNGSQTKTSASVA